MRWLKPAMYPLRNREGQIGGQILVLYDVTETHQLQEIRQDLVETMVHDLRNPLTIVRGSTELLIEDREGLPAEVIKLIEMIQASNTQCLELVNRISSLHRLENDQLYLDKRAVELFDVTNKIVQPLQTLADAKEQKLEVEVPPQLPPIYVDPGILQRILQNLLDNAIKFTPEGGTIRLAAQPHDGSIHVIVSDTGPGIPAELRPRLFQKFATGPTKQKGSGLGLAFCKLAVEAHGGQIWVESKAGQGSQFGFTLPVL
jgi:signal transduction histidine kinase